MAPPLYFFPTVTLPELLDRQRLNPSILDRYGLQDVLGDVNVAHTSRFDLRAKGPGDKSGALVTTNTDGQPPVRAGYFPDFQDWHKVRNDPELWIGIDKEHPPTPGDLVRPSTIAGHRVTLADGHDYEVPIVRSLDPSGTTNLPRDMYYDAAGQFVVTLRRDYQALWDEAATVSDFFFSEEEDNRKKGFSEILRLCVLFLGVNYRYGQAEQAVLRLVNTSHSTWEQIFRAVADMPFVERVLEEQKKTESPLVPDTPSSEPGPPADTPDTGPVEGNST